MSEITILNLSDIHFKKKKDDNIKSFRQQLQQELIQAVKVHSEKHDPPDFVVVTGDIAFSGQKHEYSEALEFFEKLKVILPKETECLVVPGNHDVDRTKVNKFFSLHQLVKQGKTDEFLDSPEQIKGFINIKFKSYRDFIDRLNPELYESKDDYFWVKRFENKDVSFLGLNSCWASEGDNDQLNIALGYQQVIDAMERCSETQNRILLMHHPLYNWLEERDFAKCSGVLFQQCSLILHGHVHIDSAQRIDTPSDSCISLGSNAAYTHNGYIGFQFIRVQFTGTEQNGTNENNWTKVHVRPYRLETRERLVFVPDTHRWVGQKGRPYFFLETRGPCGIDEMPELQPLQVPKEYQDWILQFHSRMDMECLDPDARAYHIALPQVYIPLETNNPFFKPKNEPRMKEKEFERVEGEEEGEQGEPQFIDIQELLGRCACILLRGSAGMGKTTLIKHLSYTVTQGQGPVSLCGCLPVMIFLKDLWPIYEKYQKEISAKKTDAAFKSLLNIYLETKVGTLKLEEVELFLTRNRAMFLLDGLDEIPEHFRQTLVEILAAFWLKHKNNRFLLTGRPHGIDDMVKKHFGQFLHDIELLDDKKIKEFIRKWFSAVSGQAEGVAKVTAAEMIGDIENNEHVSIFTQNPLLLTAVCVLYLDNKRLPDQRAELYRRIVDNLLYRRFHQRMQPERVSKIEDYLKLLAFHMQIRKRRSIDVGEARELLGHYFPRKDEPLSQYNKTLQQLFEEIEPHCGLLKRLGEGEVEFFHLSFQEFMAARHMLYTDIDYDKFLEEKWWQETLLLYIGLLNKEWKDKTNRLIDDILKRSQKSPGILCHLWLLGSKALRDIQEYKRDQSVVQLAREKLITIIESDASLEERFEAGDILGALGDPRIKEPPMIHVESGEFTRGSDEYDWEKPIRRIYLDKFMIGKYPVTNQEFKAFVQDGGYKKEDLWTPDGLKWLKEENISEPLYWHDRKWNGPNFPVVGVSWYEAYAYAKWLSQQTGYNYALPTEAQWEKAARGTDGKIYPWGDKFNKNFCNSYEGGLKHTSPVGIFPAGKSPYGCMDMAGNVWEWCADWYQEDYYSKSPDKNPEGPLNGSDRVIRGGGWGFVDWYCRSASRYGNHPADRDVVLGFRLVRSL
jgi:formylglycine-generating enzyme required for sulfatase activity/3',5'-cyclic AMP phosphodiesterase CpdA